MNTVTVQQGEWHNYGNGSIYWRVTPQGVEVKGKGVLKDPKFTQQAAKIWQTYQRPITAASQKYGVPIPILIATISTESSGNAKAYRAEPAFYTRYIKDHSPWKDNPYYKFPARIAASYGLIQIMYPTAYSVGFRGQPEDLYDPAANLDVGAAYIASPFQVKNHQWDPPKVAAAYNAGSLRPTTQNAWGLFCYGDHLDRWIPAYNGAIEVIGSQAAATPPKPPAAGQTPSASAVSAPPPGPQPGAPQVTLRLLLPGDQSTPWKQITVDLFKHTEHGLDTAVSYIIASPMIDPKLGYVHEIGRLAPGLYDLVFADAGSGAVLYDVADVDAQKTPTVVDLRAKTGAAPSARPVVQSATVRLRFPKNPGQPWKPVIVDVSKQTGSGSAEPVSYTITTPADSPDGGYQYDLPNLTLGVYDLVFTDAASQSVIQDVADYTVNQAVMILDLRRNRSMPPPAAATANGIWARVQNFWQKLFGG